MPLSIMLLKKLSMGLYMRLHFTEQLKQADKFLYMPLMNVVTKSKLIQIVGKYQQRQKDGMGIQKQPRNNII